jgi:thiosulfate/3-mercaptopyruvate sulfurtransferase
MVALPGSLVSGAWLLEHGDEVAIVDTRSYLDGRSGRDAYDGGHIPGAVFLDLGADLSSPPSADGGRHPLPDPEAFASSLGAVGIGDDDPVVAYDDAGGSIAARLWWMLDVLGRPAAVLDGGLAAWPGPRTTESAPPQRVERRAVPWPADRFVDTAELDVLRSRPDVLLLDARSRARYAAGDPAIDTRGGHIPGAVSAPWVENLDPAGAFLPAAALRERFGALGAADRRVVASCGSGVTACHDLLALRLAGITDTALYTPSWSGWSADPDRPAALGDEP